MTGTRRPTALVAFGLAALVVTGCAASSASPVASGGRLRVVAAENMWGSIAAEIGGDRVDATSVVSNPDADPHEYEPTTQDARDIAAADYVVTNGLGYDAWAGQAVEASPSSHRRVLDI